MKTIIEDDYSIYLVPENYAEKFWLAKFWKDMNKNIKKIQNIEVCFIYERSGYIDENGKVCQGLSGGGDVDSKKIILQGSHLEDLYKSKDKVFVNEIESMKIYSDSLI